MSIAISHQIPQPTPALTFVIYPWYLVDQHDVYSQKQVAMTKAGTVPKDERCRIGGRVVLRMDQNFAAASLYHAVQVWQTLLQHAARSNDQARNEHMHSEFNCNQEVAIG